MKIIITENQLKKLILNEQKELPRKDFTLSGNIASQKLWDHIRQWESLRLFTYDDAVYPSVEFEGEKRDSVGTLTIGYGHTGDDVEPGQKITKDKANELLIEDVNDAADCIKRWIGRQKKRDEKNNTKYHLLTQGMYDAMVDIVFNRGCNWFVNSSIITNIENGQYKSAKQKISKLSGDSDRWSKTAEFFKY